MLAFLIYARSKMLQISTEGLGKKYFREWIFRRMDYRFSAGSAYAITGPNGSGKSTLLKTLSGAIPASEGKLSYTGEGGSIDSDYWPRYISYAAPYQELIEEFTLAELLQFHFSLKKLMPGLEQEALPEKMYLEEAIHKQIKYFSSGMKQRLKLGLAFFAASPVLMLDEPTSNMDTRGMDWYLQQIEEVKASKLLLICSNQPAEYRFCEQIIDIMAFKNVKKD